MDGRQISNRQEEERCIREEDGLIDKVLVQMSLLLLY